jgi:hexokinase
LDIFRRADVHCVIIFRIDYLADSVDAFLTTHATTEYASPNEETLPVQGDVHLGLTFSFPVEQTALGSGKILTWTKGFSAKNAIGNDVVKLLQDAFDRKRMNVKCVALVNDVSFWPFLSVVITYAHQH